jgi:hypothetical protein
MPAVPRQTIRVKFNRSGTGINSTAVLPLLKEIRSTLPDEDLHDDYKRPSFHCGQHWDLNAGGKT